MSFTKISQIGNNKNVFLTCDSHCQGSIVSLAYIFSKGDIFRNEIFSKLSTESHHGGIGVLRIEVGLHILQRNITDQVRLSTF